MIINKSGITIRLRMDEISVQGRATQGNKLIDLKKRNDVISSVCLVPADDEEEALEQDSENTNGSADENVDDMTTTANNSDEEASTNEE